jgi:hypothetical protein
MRGTGIKITRSVSCLQLFDVLKNLTAKMAVPEDGADERRNVSAY